MRECEKCKKAFLHLGYEIENDLNKHLDIGTLLIIPRVGHFGTA